MTKISYKLNINNTSSLDEFLKTIQLQGPSKLKLLYLTSKHIGDDGAKSIGKVLKYSKLISLYLTANQITDIGALAIANGIKGSKLYDIDLSLNPINDIETIYEISRPILINYNINWE